MKIKPIARRLLNRLGYSVRSIDSQNDVNGVEMAHDIRVLLKGKQAPIIFDVLGANEGATIDLLLSTFPDSHVYAFEPSANTFMHLKAAYGRHPRIRLENVALGATESTALFHVTKQYSVNDSLLEPVWSEDIRKVPIRVVTLDRYCLVNKVDRIDFLKVDTQGYDLNVLRGSKGLLEAKRINTLCVELIIETMYKGQPSFVEILSYVFDHGYRLLGFYEPTYVKNRFQYCDVCFAAS